MTHNEPSYYKEKVLCMCDAKLCDAYLLVQCKIITVKLQFIIIILYLYTKLLDLSIKNKLLFI